MATVFLAHDLKHDRQVAIKVLHQDLAAALGPERFLAEIKTTARLQHPHILPLLDSGSAAGLLYYVMPYVAGESLRDRLTREKQLPNEDAVRIAREVADALGHAHGHGIIHRDIQPENILLQEGHALAADFGIALAVQSAGGQRMTQTGLSLGTPQYMRSRAGDGGPGGGRADGPVRAGAVTYEMLTGEPPFTGVTVQAIVAKVMAAEPARPTEVRRTIPPHLETAVLKALAKLPADRFARAREFAEALAPVGEQVPTARVPQRGVPARRGEWWWQERLRDPMTLALGTVALVLLAALVTALERRPVVNQPKPTRFVLSVADSEPVLDQFPYPAAISPDGSIVVYVAQRGAATQLYAHRTDALEAHPIPGTEGGTMPCFSPDGNWIAFESPGSADNQGGALRKVRLDGSTMSRLTTAGTNYGADWTVRDEIILGSEGDLRGLVRLSAAGGDMRAITRPDAADAVVENSEVEL